MSSTFAVIHGSLKSNPYYVTPQYYCWNSSLTDMSTAYFQKTCFQNHSPYYMQNRNSSDMADK